MSYSNISNFGSNMYSPVNNPLSYCLVDGIDQRFMHGSQADTLGRYSKSCQLYLPEYCSEKWDGFCEVASLDKTTYYPNQGGNHALSIEMSVDGLTAGEALIHDTACRKYLVDIGNCELKFEPFDATVATSPMISYFVPNSDSGTCTPVYEVNPAIIDQDVVMDKILAKPVIAKYILINIYNTMKRKGTLAQLKGTKIGYFFSNQPYFKNLGGLD